MNNIGPHIIGAVGPHLALLQRWQPTALLLLDPSAEDAAMARQTCPRTFIVARLYVPDDEVEQRIRRNPEEAARWAHELVMRHTGRQYVNAWQIANEICQFADGLPLLTRFERERMRLADEAGYKCALFGFSVGQPDMPEADRMALWRLTYPALEYAERKGHVVLVHQYGAPDLWGPSQKGGADWLLHRLEHQVLPRLPYKNLRFVVGEYGIDGGLLRDLGQRFDHWPGWRTFTTAEAYARDLINVGNYCAQWRTRVIGYCVFTLGHYPPWGDFDIAGEVAERLAAWEWGYDQATRQPTLPPATGGTMEPEVYDQDNTRKDLEWLRAIYGARYVRADAQGGQAFRLAQIRVTEGPATCTVRVQEGNTGLRDHGVAFSWPDGTHTLTGANFKTIYRPRAAVQWTDVNGYTGFGLGPGAYITSPDVGGVHAVWVLHHLYPSDVLDRVGMLAGTNHKGPLHLVFALAHDTGAGMTIEEKLAALRNKAWNSAYPTGGIAHNPEAAFAKFARRRALGVPVTQEGRFLGLAYQGFAQGILWCQEGQWDKIALLEW